MNVLDYYYSNPHHRYENIDFASNHNERRMKKTIIICVLYCALLAAGVTSLVLLQSHHSRSLHKQRERVTRHKVMHLTDPHVDLYFNPHESVTGGGCHACALARYNSSSILTPEDRKMFHCPSEKELKSHMVEKLSDFVTNKSAVQYFFGRYGCDPPISLWLSLLSAMKKEDNNPPVIVFTGDVAPHTYPDDKYVVSPHTKVEDLCLTKFYVTKLLLEQIVFKFPTTKFAFAIGNNDHFPKNVYWQPYIDLLGEMMLSIGFLTKHQYDQFVSFGSNFIDVEKVRYISLDMTLFKPDGEIILPGQSSVIPKLLHWLEISLQEAFDKKLAVYFVGHQPLSTRFGFDELDVDGDSYIELHSILAKYSSIIRVGLFGHNNVENFIQVLSPEPEARPIFPAIVATGISPRAPNRPALNIIYKSAEHGTILDIQQLSFDLQHENSVQESRLISSFDSPQLRAESGVEKESPWVLNNISWASLSGANDFSTASLNKFLHEVDGDSVSFLKMEVMKRGGYVGRTTPELFVCKAMYDRADEIPKCMFPAQDMQCWDPFYWVK